MIAHTTVCIYRVLQGQEAEALYHRRHLVQASGSSKWWLGIVPRFLKAKILLFRVGFEFQSRNSGFRVQGLGALRV